MAPQVELDDEDVVQAWGALLWAACQSFISDPMYFTAMAESAKVIDYRRELWEARSQAITRADVPSQVPGLTEKILAERGIPVPRSVKRKVAA